MQMHKFILLFFLVHFSNLEAKDSFSLLPGPHRDLVIQNCLACHSERLILQSHMTRKAWDSKITWMQERQNLWPLAPDVRSKILDYLEKTQGLVTFFSLQDPLDGLTPRHANPLLE